MTREVFFPHIACGVTENCSLQELVMEAPEFDANSLGVTVTFYRKKENLFFKSVMQLCKCRLHKKEMQKTTQKTTQKMIELMRSNPTITIESLCKECGLTRDGVNWNIRKLKSAGLIRRIGPDKGGHWEVVEE